MIGFYNKLFGDSISDFRIIDRRFFELLGSGLLGVQTSKPRLAKHHRPVGNLNGLIEYPPLPKPRLNLTGRLSIRPKLTNFLGIRVVSVYRHLNGEPLFILLIELFAVLSSRCSYQLFNIFNFDDDIFDRHPTRLSIAKTERIVFAYLTGVIVLEFLEILGYPAAVRLGCLIYKRRCVKLYKLGIDYLLASGYLVFNLADGNVLGTAHYLSIRHHRKRFSKYADYLLFGKPVRATHSSNQTSGVLSAAGNLRNQHFQHLPCSLD